MSSIIQIQKTIYTTQSSTVTTIPADNTIPQITEGVEAFTCVITPTSTLTKLLITVWATTANSASGNYIGLCLFNTDVHATNCISAGMNRIQAANSDMTTCFWHELQSPVASATTFRVRYGANGGTTYINQDGTTANLYGGALTSGIIIMEYA